MAPEGAFAKYATNSDRTYVLVSKYVVVVFVCGVIGVAGLELWRRSKTKVKPGLSAADSARRAVEM